jgi:hypothetical protein
LRIPHSAFRVSVSVEDEVMSELTTADRLEINEVLALYCHCIDRGRWDGFAEIFTDDCRLDLRPLLALFEGKAGIVKFIETLKPLPITMRHYNCNAVIRGNAGSARAESYVLALTGAEGNLQQTTGFYEDEFVKQQGRWKIRSRRLIPDVKS